MNAVEIEEAISALAEQPFDPEEFPYAFLEAFGDKATTIKRLRSGASNKSDLGGVLQTNNIHIKVCSEGQVTQTLAALKSSPATTAAMRDKPAFGVEIRRSGLLPNAAHGAMSVARTLSDARCWFDARTVLGRRVRV